MADELKDSTTLLSDDWVALLLNLIPVFVGSPDPGLDLFPGFLLQLLMQFFIAGHKRIAALQRILGFHFPVVGVRGIGNGCVWMLAHGEW